VALALPWQVWARALDSWPLPKRRENATSKGEWTFRMHVDSDCGTTLGRCRSEFGARFGILDFSIEAVLKETGGNDVVDVIPRASPKSAEHSEFQVITAHAEPLRKSTHFLHQNMSPFTMLPSVLFYKEGLYIFTEHSSKHWRGSPFTGSPHHHLVRVGVNTSILILIVSILLYLLQASLIAYAIWQFELK
jgi:hypothetical protein